MERKLIAAGVLILTVCVLCGCFGQLDPAQEKAPLIAGLAYLRQKDYSQAERLLKQAVRRRLDPVDKARAHYALAGVFANTHRLDAASAQLRECMKAAPSFVPENGRSPEQVLAAIEKRRQGKRITRLQPVDPVSGFAWKGMFYSGVVLMAGIIIGLFVFGYKLLPKGVKTRSVTEFARASRISFFLDEDKRVLIPRDHEDFNKIISQFSDQKKNPDEQVSSRDIYLKVGMGTIVLQVSTAGWNFKGESRNSRRLNNGMELIELISKQSGS